MAMIDVELAHLHGPHFHITGINLSATLDTRKRREMKLQWNPLTKELIVNWGGRDAHIPEPNVMSWFPMGKEGPGKHPENNAAPMVKLTHSAQVSTPQDHVHAGLGHGKSK